ncbi:MAG: SpoIID/LytB domain-containing protein [Candidatus Omnitrophica bacterium]|nr:SpoIID/LytB domain-containing protein [Candidatus Omnitrophota bacterium]
MPLLALILFAFNYSYGYAQTIRVAVLQNVSKFSLTINGSYQILLPYNQELISQGGSLKDIKVTATTAGVQFGEQEFPVFGVTVRIPESQRGFITVNGRHFRGGMDVYRQKNQTLLVVNHVDVEDYLQGVLYHEVSHRWPSEVLRAQAVAARTYAIYQTTVSQSKDFDVTSDVFSQVYGGATSEKRRTNRAVEATRGIVLVWNNQIFPAYFHAACGGNTLASNELWKIEIPPLLGVKCSFCAGSPHFYWKTDMSKETLLARLKKADYPLKDIDGIEMIRNDAAGRALDLILFHPDGQLNMSANAFRLAAGPNEIRSTFFTVDIQNQQIVFRGRGWGHGVGLCQWGAYGMSRQGKKMEEILSYYYPGAEIVKIE